MSAGEQAVPVSRWQIPPFVRRNIGLIVVYGLLAALVIVGALNSERFLTERNIFNVLRQAAFLGMVALGQMLVILTAGIDLSVGALVKMSVLVAALLMNGQPENTALAVGATLGLGVLVGTFHAFVITRLRVPPFVVTLGTFSILRGLALTIATRPVGRATPDVLGIYDLRVGPVPVLVIFFAVLIVIALVVLRRTKFGRYVYAVGGDEQVARLSGIPVNRVKYGVYIACSVLATVTGLMWLSRMGVGDPVIGEGLELETITAVILGGTSLFGGVGGVIGTVGGVLLLGVTNNLLVVLNVNQWIQQLIQGIIIVAAVALYKQPRRR